MTASASRQAAADSTTAVAPVDVDLPLGNADSPDPAKRHGMISEAAFLIAQERGFAPGQELDDWLAAEREFDRRS